MDLLLAVGDPGPLFAPVLGAALTVFATVVATALCLAFTPPPA